MPLTDPTAHKRYGAGAGGGDPSPRPRARQRPPGGTREAVQGRAGRAPQPAAVQLVLLPAAHHPRRPGLGHRHNGEGGKLRGRRGPRQPPPPGGCPASAGGRCPLRGRFSSSGVVLGLVLPSEAALEAGPTYRGRSEPRSPAAILSSAHRHYRMLPICFLPPVCFYQNVYIFFFPWCLINCKLKFTKRVGRGKAERFGGGKGFI